MARKPGRPFEVGADKFFAAAVQELGLAVSEIAYDVAAQASTNRAPVDTDNLRANIDPEVALRVDQIKGTVSKNVIAATPYALVQHENMDFNHPKGGGPKYLSGPLEERKDRYEKRIADAVRTALERAAI
jgi:hypothetical protein